ncbi:PP2C family protein-serine/threonine phosphatase [bacterium]|nr:PP2C family protein-serine/threonine phosphatase [bacterium]MCI0604960.1 PP2C family protein-serine/threonine phosphatase [bacterium]
MDHRTLLIKLENTLRKIESSPAIGAMLQGILTSIIQELGPELGIRGGRVYEAANRHYQLISQSGDSQAPDNFSISMEYPCVQVLKQEGQILANESHPCFDPEIEGPLGISRFAAISLGDNDEYVISFTLSEPVNESQVEYALTLIRHVANYKIRATRLEFYISEARKIQMSLLPQEFPNFYGFDIYGKSVPAEIVGGDIFDVIPISDTILGLAIADASGHGLPAALQVRDVYVGLRMGLEKDQKIVRTMQKLNHVLAQAGKSHEFITLFYAELEDNGNLFYCNAGHHPPLFFGHSKVHELGRGGLILGPYPNAKYERGFAYFEPGNLLVMYTDGISEGTNSVGEEFGTERITKVVKKHRDATSKEICEAIFAAAEKFVGHAKAKDDRTVMVIKR